MADRDLGDAPEANATLLDQERALRAVFAIFRGMRNSIKGLALFFTARDDGAAMETMTELFHGNQ